MRMLSLFSGIGGIDLAAEWAGIKTVAFCEIEPYCQKVLAKHWPWIPIFPDVRKLDKEALKEVLKDGPIDIVAGGYPCQPFSTAGKRRGAEDDRHLWPEVKRILSELRPRWFVGENVAGHVSLGLDTVLSDLESEGYTSQTFIIPACAVNAPHRRDRVFIVAHSGNVEGRDGQQRSPGGNGKRELDKGKWSAETVETTGPSETSKTLAHTDGELLQRNWSIRQQVPNARLQQFQPEGSSQDVCHPAVAGLPDWAGGEMGQPSPLTEFERPSGREVERNFRGVAYGIARRVDRLRALGNAVVPQQIYPILKCIVDIEKNSPLGGW